MNFDLNSLKEFDTYIFDFDGTLINSEPYHKIAHGKILSLLLNKEINLTDEQYANYIGKTDKQIFSEYKRHFSLDFDAEKFAAKKAEMARDMLLSDEVKVFDYFYRLLAQKADSRYYIVSNAHAITLSALLDAKDIAKYFDEVFLLSEMGVGKEYFYANLKEFIPNAAKCVVFEDNATILNYLIGIGVSAVAVCNDYNYKDILGKFDNIIKV